MRDDTDIGGPRGRFPTTHRSAVLAAGSPDSAERERGFGQIVETYWKPVYKTIRHKWGAGNEEAKDLTQGFFALAFEKGFFSSYETGKGSFRTFLRVCLDGFVSNERKAAGRQRRGPGSPILSLDFTAAEGELAAIDVSTGQSAEDFFRAETVRSLFGLSVEALREECARRGKDLAFALFDQYDLDAGLSADLRYSDLARERGITETEVLNQLAFARRTFRRLVLERLRTITGSEREFREEARAILGRDTP